MILEAETIDVEQYLPYDDYIDGDPKEDFMMTLTTTQTLRGNNLSPTISSASVTLRKDLSDFGKSFFRGDNSRKVRLNSLPTQNEK